MSVLNSVKDTKWLQSAFLAKAARANMLDTKAATATTADLKFTDTSLGGNFAINSPPQFTRYADIKRRGLGVQSKGMGRYYSEAIDDNSQVIHMRFGVPVFNNLATFIAGMHDTKASLLARTGRAGGIFFSLGEAAGFVVSVMSWKLQAIALLGKAAGFFFGIQTSKFYTLRPSMVIYWNAVQTMVNHIATNMGVIPRVLGTETQHNPNKGYTFDSAAMNRMNEMMPEIFSQAGNIDVYAVAGRAQRMLRNQYKAVMAADGEAKDYSAFVTAAYAQPVSAGQTPMYRDYIKSWTAAQVNDPQKAQSTVESIESLKQNDPSFIQYLEGEMDDGSAFASFRVNYTGSVQEQFSNQTGEAAIASKLNSLASSARSLNYSWAGGNLFAGMDQILGAVKDVVGGALAGVGLGGVTAAVTGGAFVDLPNEWKSSMVNLPTSTYTVHLVSPYNNPLSQLMHIYVPLCMLLAGVMPLSTGKQTYTSPLMLEYYDKGRAQSRLGMIESMSITRGTANQGFTADGNAIGIEVSFTIKDMSNVMHMPIAMGTSMFKTIAAGALGGAPALANAVFSDAFDQDTVFSDYMSVLSGLGLADQIYTMRKLKLNMTKAMLKWDSWTSKSRLAMVLGDTMPGRLVSNFYTGVGRGE